MDEELNNTLDAFIDLSENWDSYSASKINPANIDKAKELLKSLPDWNWQAVPCTNGEVQLEMHQDGFDIEIYIDVSQSMEHQNR